MGVSALFAKLHATPSTWTGAINNDLAFSSNWTASTIPTGDVATFPVGATTTNPSLTPGELLNLSQAVITGGNYTFDIIGNSSNNATLSFGTSPSSGVGVTNQTTSPTNVNFNVTSAASAGLNEVCNLMEVLQQILLTQDV